MTNHLEIKYSITEHSGIFEKKSRILYNFLFHANRNYEQIPDASRRIEKPVEHPKINNFVLYLAYDIIVIS